MAKKALPKRKAPSKKKPAAERRARAKKVAPKPHVTAIRQKMTKTAILAAIADKTGLSRKQVGGVLDELEILWSAT